MLRPIYIDKYINTNQYIIHLYIDINILVYQTQYIDISNIAIYRCHPYWHPTPHSSFTIVATWAAFVSVFLIASLSLCSLSLNDSSLPNSMVPMFNSRTQHSQHTRGCSLQFIRHSYDSFYTCHKQRWVYWNCLLGSLWNIIPMKAWYSASSRWRNGRSCASKLIGFRFDP